MFYNDSNDVPEGPVVVTQPVYDAGMKLEAEVKAGTKGPGFENARHKSAACREDGDTSGADFWEEVFHFLMWRESVAAETETIILKDGENYDFDEGKVIRPGTNRPRSDKDYR